MVQKIFAAALMLSLWAGSASAQCEESRPVLVILESNPDPEARLTPAERAARRVALVDQALTQHPDDIFLLLHRMQLEGGHLFRQGAGHDALVAWAEAMRHKHPGAPAYDFLYAKALLGKNTPEALRIFEELRADRTIRPQAHLALADAFSFGKFQNTARASRELASYLKLCPAPFNGLAIHLLTRFGTPRQIAAASAGVRRRLTGQTSREMRGIWALLWRLEFKARPPAEHGALRKQIAADIAQFDKPDDRRLDTLTFLQAAYESAGDTAAVERVKDEIVQRYPATNETKRIVQDRWEKDHRSPPTSGEAEMVARTRERLRVLEQWLERWPDDASLWFQKFRAQLALPGTLPEELTKSADRYFDTHAKDPSWFMSPPAEFDIARAFLKYKVRIEQVPAIVERGFQPALKRAQQMAGGDDRIDEQRKEFDAVTPLKLERARILLDYYAATNQPAKARDLDAELAAIEPPAGFKSMLLAVRARAAEISGRKLDALMMSRAAIEARTRPLPAGAKDDLAENVERLWKELGGTPAALAFLGAKPSVAVATDSRWERPRSALPAFSLPDLRGKTWKLVDFKGKAVLANIWATWCGPCRAEHAEFQRLFDKLKNRKDVAVVSINMDDDLGKVAPYMKENKYSFPVLLGREVVDAVVASPAIPRNWFISPAGTLEWEQIGFGGDPKWLETMTAKLEELLPRKGGT